MSREHVVDIVIPARDEEDALPAVLNDIDPKAIRRIVVVDNGSKDKTAEIARVAGCHVVSCLQPGYGRACLAGMRYLEADPPDILVFLDGDHSDFPQHLGDLVGPIAADRRDFVLGSRNLGEAEPGSLSPVQRFGNGLATKLLRLFWRFPYSDLGPFRAIKWESLMKLGMVDQNFGWTIEMQIKAVVCELRIQEVSVPYRPRIGQSKISGTLSGCVCAGWKILWTVLKYRWASPSPTS